MGSYTHLMDVNFFENPTWENWVKATRAYNQSGKKPRVMQMASPFIDDTAKAMQSGYKEFMSDFKNNRKKAQEGISKGQKDANDWIKDHGVEDYALGQTRLGVEPFAFMSKKHIAEYQKLMQKRGFYTGKIDSIPGPKTRDAHKRMITGTPIKPLKDVIVDFMKEKIK